LHGEFRQIATFAQAIDYLRSYEESWPSTAPAVRYEIEVRFNNGDVLRGALRNKEDAIDRRRRSIE
jgi:hypothetical protein